MIKEILKLMAEGDFSFIEMAQRMSLSQAELKDRIELMKHMGYIAAEDIMGAGAGGGCASCHFAKRCSVESRNTGMRIITYQLTEKGKRVCGI